MINGGKYALIKKDIPAILYVPPMSRNVGINPVSFTMRRMKSNCQGILVGWILFPDCFQGEIYEQKTSGENCYMQKQIQRI